MSPDSGSLAPPNGMVPQAHALGNTGHGTIHTYRQTSIHPSIHTYIHTQTYRPIYLPTYLHTYIPTYLRTYVPTYLRTYVHTYIHTCMHACVHACMDAYIHTYLHTYIHTHQHSNIPTYQHTTTTGHRGGTRRTIPPPQATGGGTRRTIPPSQATGGGPWVGGGLGRPGSFVFTAILHVHLHSKCSFTLWAGAIFRVSGCHERRRIIVANHSPSSLKKNTSNICGGTFCMMGSHPKLKPVRGFLAVSQAELPIHCAETYPQILGCVHGWNITGRTLGWGPEICEFHFTSKQLMRWIWIDMVWYDLCFRF